GDSGDTAEPALTFYGPLQCSKGISGSDCLTCLDRLTVSYMLLLNQEKEEGGLLVAPSCNLRYDTVQFFAVSTSSHHGSKQIMFDNDYYVDATHTEFPTIHRSYSSDLLENIQNNDYGGHVCSFFFVEESDKCSEFLQIELGKLREVTK
ncbi:hypothetical protein LINPERHAP2_LOCUS23752, partial [Linum perenne]